MPTLDEIKVIINQKMDEYLKPQKLSMKPGPKRAGPLATAKTLAEYYARDITYYTNYVNEIDKIENALERISANSLGIHFIYESPGEGFWIFQCIYSDEINDSDETNDNNETGELEIVELNRDNIKSFFDIHEKIVTEQHKAMNKYVGDAYVQDLLDGFTKQSSVKYVLLTNTVVSESDRDYFNKLWGEKSDMFEDGVQWELVDLEKIKSEYDKRESADSEPTIITIPDIPKYINLPISDKNNKKHESIVMILPGTVLSDWSEYKDNLFNENIRGFLGNKPINKSITTTLANEADLFYLYNNGISAICTKMEIEPNPSGVGETMTCTNFQIINGAQTVNSIFNFSEKGDLLKKLENVNVLVRITEMKADETKKEKAEQEENWIRELKRNMITYNNSQNVVKDADFRSNDLIQDVLKAKFKERKIKYRATYPPLDVVYMPKRAYCSEKGKVIVYMDSMAKSLYAFKKKKSMVKINSMSNFLFDDSEDGEYWFLFGDENGNPVKKMEKDKFDDGKFDEFAAIVILNHFLDSRLKEGRDRTNPDEIEGMVFRTGRLFLWAFGHVIPTFYTDSKGEIYAKIIDGKAFESKPKTDRNSFIDIWYDHIYRSVRTLLTEEAKSEAEKVTKTKAKKVKTEKLKIGEADKENVKTLNFKGWLRSEEKTGQLKDELDDIYDDLLVREKLPKIK